MAVKPRIKPVASTNPPPQQHIGTAAGPVVVHVHAPKAPAPKPAAPKPAAPTAPPATPPPDPAYLSQVAGLQQGLVGTLAGLKTGRANQLLATGYSEDPVSGSLAFNPNDAFSKAALLKKTYDASRARTGQAMGSGGQLYTGAYQQAQDMGARDQLGAETSLHNSLAGWLAANTSNQAQAPITEQMAEGTAYGNMLARQAANYNPPATAGAGKAAPVKTMPPLTGRTIAANPSGKGPAKGTKLVIGRKTPKGRIGTYTNTVKGP